MKRATRTAFRTSARESRNWLRVMYQSYCVKTGIGTGKLHRGTEHFEWLNIEACNFIYIEYITKQFGTLKWLRRNRNIDSCDFEESRFNCRYFVAILYLWVVLPKKYIKLKSMFNVKKWFDSISMYVYVYCVCRYPGQCPRLAPVPHRRPHWSPHSTCIPL